MPANRNEVHRRSVPVTSQEHSQVIAQRERRQEGDSSLSKDLHISSSGRFDHERNRKFLLPRVVSHHSSEDIGSLEAEHAPGQNEAPPCLHDDIARKKIEAMKIDRYQEDLSKLKGKKPDCNMSYQAGKKEVTRTPRKRARSYSFSDWVNTLEPELELNKGDEDVQVYLKKYDSKNSKETRQSVKLPRIFETQVPSTRHCVSTSYAEFKFVQYASDDMNRSTLKKCRNQQYIGLQDKLLDKDLRLRVKDFLEKPQPKASTPSLRINKIPDIQLEGKETKINRETSTREQFAGVPINTNSCPLMSHFKGRKWYYQDKTGKCRYLRVPDSPVPPVSFVFTKD